MAFTRFKWMGATPGNNGNTTILFATTLTTADAMNANLSECWFALVGGRKFCLLLDHSHGGTLNAYASDDRGANWRQIDTAVIAAPAAAASTAYEFLVEGLRDFKLEWVNGGTAQSPWMPNMSLSDDRASAL